MKPNIGRSRWDVVWCVLWSNGVTREKMTAGFVPRIAAAIGDDSGAQVRSRLVVTLMLGLANRQRRVVTFAHRTLIGGVVAPQSFSGDPIGLLGKGIAIGGPDLVREVMARL